jgi:hypothetical protein
VHVFRSHHIPITLRTSALSLLSVCLDTSALAFLPYATDLSTAMIDLLQVESTPQALKLHGQKSEPSNDAQLKSTMESESTLTDSKHPSLRRAALHLLALLLRASIAGVYDSGYQGQVFPGPDVKRAKTTLLYVASTDVDSMVRVMAREAMEQMEQLNEAIMGI